SREDPARPLGRSGGDRGVVRVLRLGRGVVHHWAGPACRRRNGDLMVFAGTGRDAWIVEALRTPMGRAHSERGWFRDVHANEMLGAVYTALLHSTGLAPLDVEDLIVGCTAPFGEQSRNVARNAWLQAGYPPEVPA